MLNTPYGTMIIMVALLTIPAFAQSEGSRSLQPETTYSCIAYSFRPSDETYASAEFAVPIPEEVAGFVVLEERLRMAFFASLNLSEPWHYQGRVSCHQSGYYPNYPNESYAEVVARDYRKTGRKPVETNWTPAAKVISEVVEMARRNYPWAFMPPQDAAADLFSPKARDATKTWMERNDIAPTGDAESTLALMVQTALALQNFDPGPRDGKIGRKTLAAIAAWQAIVGLLAGADLADVLAAILHTAMTLQGLDPGPVHSMFGQDALDTVAAWQTAHGPALEEARRAQPGYGEESDDRLLSSSWRRVPDALACVSIDYSERHLTQFLVNQCDHPVRVEWCYVGKTGIHGQWQCDPGPPGLGFMDRIGHRATRKGVGVPDYYTSGAGLRAKPGGDRVQGHDHQPMPAVGRVRYIACGYDHIAGARHYDMEWDAHTGQFRCLAYFVPDEPGVAPKSGVQ